MQQHLQKKYLTLSTFVLLLLTFISLLHSVESPNDLLKNLFAEGISIDLCEPTFSSGVFTTDKGGIISAPNLRIQARKLVYTKKMSEGEPVFTLVAEKDLMV